MEALFKALGAAVALYLVYSLVSGSVYAKHRAWGRMFHRDEDAAGYWSAIAAYAVVASLLLFVF